MKDYYYILGIQKNASESDIKKAYRKLSIKFHPDKNDGDVFFENRFKEVLEAYEILSNPNKKKQYDQNSQYNSYNKNENEEKLKKWYQEELNKKEEELKKKTEEFKKKDEEYRKKEEEYRKSKQTPEERDAEYAKNIKEEAEAKKYIEKNKLLRKIEKQKQLIILIQSEISEFHKKIESSTKEIKRLIENVEEDEEKLKKL